ncbi:MAG: TIGR02300 family protein [Rhodospirillales bacterium]
MAKPEWGSKHTCPSCGAKFYDLKRNPIICPSCEQEVVVQPVLKSRRSAPAEPKAPAPVKEAPKAKPADNDDDDEAIADDDDDLVLDGDDDDDDDDSLIEDTSDLDDDSDVAVVADKDGGDDD